MNDIIKQFNNARQKEDLFQFWQDEIRLRNCMRTCTSVDIVLNGADDGMLDFLYRSLYWTNRPHLFNILFINMNNLTIFKWINSNSDLAHEFLSDVPYQILGKQPDFRHLQFLINIYRAEYHSEFLRIVNVLGAPACEELLKRTANQDLRILLRERLIKLQKQQSVVDYGIKTSHRWNTSYPTLFGDKLHLILRAANALRGQQSNALEPDPPRQFAMLMDAAGAVFEAGLVEDSLAILAEAYMNYLDNNRSVDFEEEAHLYQLLHRLLRRIIPVYALFSEPSVPFINALSLYRSWFGLVSPEPASLEFLKIYETIKEGTGPGHNIMMEISLKAAVIKEYRPDDVFLNGLRNWGRQPDMAAIMHGAVLERMKALPHEAFIILEFLRLAEKCYPGSSNGLNLLKDYMELWKWVPEPLFLNPDMVQELGSDSKTRRQAEKMVNTKSAERPTFDFMNFFARMYRGGF